MSYPSEFFRRFLERETLSDENLFELGARCEALEALGTSQAYKESIREVTKEMMLRIFTSKDLTVEHLKALVALAEVTPIRAPSNPTPPVSDHPVTFRWPSVSEHDHSVNRNSALPSGVFEIKDRSISAVIDVHITSIGNWCVTYTVDPKSTLRHILKEYLQRRNITSKVRFTKAIFQIGSGKVDPNATFDEQNILHGDTIEAYDAFNDETIF